MDRFRHFLPSWSACSLASSGYRSVRASHLYRQHRWRHNRTRTSATYVPSLAAGLFRQLLSLPLLLLLRRHLIDGRMMSGHDRHWHVADNLAGFTTSLVEIVTVAVGVFFFCEKVVYGLLGAPQSCSRRRPGADGFNSWNRCQSNWNGFCLHYGNRSKSSLRSGTGIDLYVSCDVSGMISWHLKRYWLATTFS